MLLIIVICRHGVTVFVRAFASDQNFTVSFILQLFLVNAFRTNDKPNVINSLKFRQENLGSERLPSFAVLKVFRGHPRNSLIRVNSDD